LRQQTLIGSRNPGKESIHAKGYSIELHRQGNNTVGRDVTDESADKKDGFSGNTARGRVTDSGIESWIWTGATDRTVSDQCMVWSESI
jgi:hypothetical protein